MGYIKEMAPGQHRWQEKIGVILRQMNEKKALSVEFLLILVVRKSWI